MDKNSLAHTKWECKYHIIFAPKYIGKNAKKIEEYIRNQLQEDWEYDQMTLKEYIDPFMAKPVVMISRET